MAVPRTNLVVEYTMDSINGSTLTDTSDAGGHNATIVGATVQTGIVGNCLYFPNENDGTTPGYYATMSSSFSAFTSYTISAWVKNTYASTNLAISCRNIDPHEGFFSCAGAAPKMRRNRADYYATANNSIGINTWYHIVFRVNHSTDVLNFFINGSKLGNDVTQPNDGVVVDIVGAQRAAAGYYNHMRGCIDQLRMYSRALSDQEILDLYNEYTPPTDITPANIHSVTGVSDPWTCYPKAIKTETVAEVPEIHQILGPGQDIIDVIGVGNLLCPACTIDAKGNYNANIILDKATLSAAGNEAAVANGAVTCEQATLSGHGKLDADLSHPKASLYGTGYSDSIGALLADALPQLTGGTGHSEIRGTGNLALLQQVMSAHGDNNQGRGSLLAKTQTLSGRAKAGNTGVGTVYLAAAVLEGLGTSDSGHDGACIMEVLELHGEGRLPRRFDNLFLAH